MMSTESPGMRMMLLISPLFSPRMWALSWCVLLGRISRYLDDFAELLSAALFTLQSEEGKIVQME